MDEKPFTADGAEMKREIALGGVNVHGTVRFGKRLLRDATVVFGTEGAKVAVRFQADEHGKFQGLVPREGWWRVTVTSESPRVNKIVDVEVEPAAKEGYSEVDVAVASYAIEGKVVDEFGAPVSDEGHLNVLKLAYPSDFFQKRIPDDISPFFRFDALNVGEYRLEFSGHKTESEIVSVMVGEDGTTDPPYLVLVARPRNIFRGRVVLPGGIGVPGAVVQVEQLVEQAFPFHGRAWTDEEGRFQVELNALAKEACFLVKRNRVWRVMRAVVSPDEQELTMSVAGGALRLQGRGTLEHAGCRFQHGPITEMPSMGPGRYRFCAYGLEPRTCVSGDLAAGGTLTLTLDEKKR